MGVRKTMLIPRHTGVSTKMVDTREHDYMGNNREKYTNAEGRRATWGVKEQERREATRTSDPQGLGRSNAGSYYITPVHGLRTRSTPA